MAPSTLPVRRMPPDGLAFSPLVLSMLMLGVSWPMPCVCNVCVRQWCSYGTGDDGTQREPQHAFHRWLDQRNIKDIVNLGHRVLSASIV